jgi:transcriptional regulator with XRE-family HTH domain
LLRQFARRRQANRRYSLRAFARHLRTDHATLSQVIRGRRSVTPRLATQFGARLGWSPAEVAGAVFAEQEARFLRLVEHPTFRADSRWLAARLALPLDRVAILLQRALRRRSLTLSSANRWLVVENPHV